YTPPTGFTGKVSFKYEVCDNAVVPKCNSAYVNIFIDPNANTNTTVAVDDSYTTKINGSVSRNVSLNDYDPQGYETSYTLLDHPAHGSILFNSDGSFTYQPEIEYSGPDRFTYQVCDAGDPVACDQATVYLNVSGENHRPIAIDDYLPWTDELANVLANDYDPDGDPVTANTVVVLPPENGTVILKADGTFTYTPDAFYFGKDSFNYEVCDDAFPALCAQATAVLVPDTDGDGIDDFADIDDDNDGVLDVDEMDKLTGEDIDSDGDGIPDRLDPDSDSDGLSDNYEAQGAAAYRPPSGVDSDGNGWDDEYDLESGGTPILLVDTDGNGISDFQDPDDDNDGILSIDEDGNSDGDLLNDDCNSNGIPDYLDAEPCDLLVPNAFSPNGDGKNDYYRVRGLQNYPNASLEVYNRWGVKVFEKQQFGNTQVHGDPGAWWDGRDQVSGEILPAGTYLFILVLDSSNVQKGIIYINR
ncbi:MAG: Ig-like domain-containing protein, partial [Mangrovibacterium sp.]